MSLSSTCTRSSTPPRVLKTGCVASSAARGRHHGRGDISGSPWAAARSPRPPACPRAMSCRVVQRGDPPAARSDIRLHAVFIVPLLRNLRRTHKKCLLRAPAPTRVGLGGKWDPSEPLAWREAHGRGAGGNQVPAEECCRAHGQQAQQPAGGAQDLLYSSQTLSIFGIFSSEAVPPCPDPSRSCHPVVPSDVNRPAGNLPGRGEDHQARSCASMATHTLHIILP